MAKMGACGVRLELNDDSGYSQVESPNAVGAVVGFAPKGELNKIQRLTNIAEQELYFGRGFNNPRHNQGMYAARAVINAGGFVEFVRPYGEEIDKTDDFKRDLKTDAFVVAYDRYAAKNAENLNKTSLNIEYFAATRYKSDRGAKYGLTRKINNIAETIVNGSNVDFGLSAGSDYSDKKNWVSNGGVARGKNDVVLFALMNADPSSANRAYTSYRLDTNEFDNSARDKGEITVTSLTKVGFAVNDIVCVPATGRITTLSKFIVKDIDDKEITLQAVPNDGGVTQRNLIAGLKPEVLFYSDTENVVADNYDYLTVKTAVAGQGAKTFSALHLDEDGLAALKLLPSGSAIVFNDQDANTVFVRVATPKSTTLTQITRTSDPSAPADATTATIKVANPDAIWVGDRIQLNWPAEGLYSAVFTVTGEDTEAKTLDISVAEIDSISAANIGNLFVTETSAITLEAPSAEWVDSTNTINLYIDKDSTVESVITDLLAAVRSGLLEFGVSSIVTDIAKNDPVGTEKYGKIKLDADGVTITVVPGGALNFLPGDIVAITRSSVEVDDSGEVYPEGAAQFNGTNIYWVGKVKNSDPISDTIELSADISGITELTQDTYVGFQLLNLTQTNKVAYAAVSKYEVKQERVTDVSGTVKTGEGYTSLTAEKASDGDASANPQVMPKYLISGSVSFEGNGTAIPSVGDTVKYKWQGATHTARVTEVVPGVEGGLPLHYVASFESTELDGSFDGNNQPVAPDIGSVSNLTYDGIVEHEDDTKSFGDIYFVGNFTTSVPSAIQTTTTVVEKDDVFVGASAPFKYYDGNYKKKGALIAQTEKVLTDTSIGATFVSLGLATLKYEDINFTGDTVKVYDLTDDGEAVARLYLSVAYMYNGNLYEFDGTIVRYVYNDRQLYIGDTAKVELEGSGVKFVLNEDDVIEMFREDNSYDLSNTVVGELQNDGSYKAIPSAVMTCPSFNENDPAIINNGVWVYDPNNNKSTSTLSNAYNLYLDKDKSDVSFFVAAGSNVNNFGFKGYESLNTQLMQAILNICELRKDCFALFDAAGDSRIKQALKLNAPASQFGSTLGRWGAIYDNRPIFNDTYITKSQVELAPSVAMASLITSNRRGSVYWHVPSGEIMGKVPGAWCSEMKYDRSFLIPESPDSDIAKLSDIHVNPFRCNEKGGIYAFGDFTMQMEDTAFNAINVTMLVAQIHKSFYNYLDARVFQLNTAELRSTITTDLQAKIDAIVGERPAGLEVGSYVKCDNENNPPEVVEAHKLMVDLYLYPTTSTRYIFLRTNVLSRSSGNTITTDLTTGSR